MNNSGTADFWANIPNDISTMLLLIHNSYSSALYLCFVFFVKGCSDGQVLTCWEITTSHILSLKNKEQILKVVFSPRILPLQIDNWWIIYIQLSCFLRKYKPLYIYKTTMVSTWCCSYCKWYIIRMQATCFNFLMATWWSGSIIHIYLCIHAYICVYVVRVVSFLRCILCIPKYLGQIQLWRWYSSPTETSWFS